MTLQVTLFLNFPEKHTGKGTTGVHLLSDIFLIIAREAMQNLIKTL
jgi:hypothetical protein